MKNKLFAFIIISYLFIANSFSQEILPDTSRIKFIGDSLIPLNVSINKITDNRADSPCVVAYGTQKKLLLIPVDREICIDKPLNIALETSLRYPGNSDKTIHLSIEHFTIIKEQRRFSAYYVLEADFIGIVNNDSIGYLSYNFRYLPNTKSKSLEQVSQDLIANWHPKFKLDIMDMYQNRDFSNRATQNFISSEYNRSHFFTAGLNSVIGLDFWQVEAEIYFNRPETSKKQVFQGGILRYQNTKNFEMIGFGKRSEHFHYRLSPKTLLDINTNLLIGINKWRNQEDIKLQQVLQLSLSSSQSFSLNPENSKGITLKIGLFENLYYIIEKTPKIQIGIYIGGGYKF